VTAYRPCELHDGVHLVVDCPGETAPRAVEKTLAYVHETFRRHLYLPDVMVIDVVLATYVANLMHGDPVWALVVGASGRGKTETIAALNGRSDVHALSSLTAQTFASGFKGRDSSLLHRLERDNKTFLTLKDLTTVLSMHRDARAEVFAQLREIYDGAYRKEFGSGVTVEWEGRLGFLAGVTPAIDQHHSATAALGERFLYLRLPEVARRRISARTCAVSSEGPWTCSCRPCRSSPHRSRSPYRS
jgi:hypothetical protein